MALLSTIERTALFSRFMSEASAGNISMPFSKSDLLTSVNNIDDWIEANMVSFNSALPANMRTALTAKQKVQLLMIVIKRRFEVE